MNCDEFLSMVETGDEAQRKGALEHAESCATCAATLAILQQIKTTLAVHEPLTGSARAVWENASRVARPVSRSRPGWAASAAVAATIAVCFVFAASTRKVEQSVVVLPAINEVEKTTTNQAAETTVLVPDVASELAELSSATKSLDEMLNSMSDQIDRMEVEREIQVTLSRFDRW